MTRVDLDVTFNYNVERGDTRKFAGMKHRDVSAGEVYLDFTSGGVLFAVETESENISIDIPNDEIPDLIMELAGRYERPEEE